MLAVCLTLTAGGNDDNFSFLFPPKFNKALQVVAVENGKNLTFLENYFPLIQGHENWKVHGLSKKWCKKVADKTITDLIG